jgi:glutamate N-acetyltransferase/amino-acid N-acetyltransferase
MPTQDSQPPSLLAVPGVRLAAVAAGIRYRNRADLVVMELAESSRCAAVFTRNAFCAAPVTLARAHLSRRIPRFLLINSGNANAGTGERGLADARATCLALAQRAGCEPEQVLPFSTGVIGEPLPVARMETALDDALADLSDNGWPGAARAIMTTDSVPKGVSRMLDVGGERIVITGIAKGAGMIRPDMATMLAYIATDARLLLSTGSPSTGIPRPMTPACWQPRDFRRRRRSTKDIRPSRLFVRP